MQKSTLIRKYLKYNFYKKSPVETLLIQSFMRTADTGK